MGSSLKIGNVSCPGRLNAADAIDRTCNPMLFMPSERTCFATNYPQASVEHRTCWRQKPETLAAASERRQDARSERPAMGVGSPERRGQHAPIAYAIGLPEAISTESSGLPVPKSRARRPAKPGWRSAAGVQ